MDEAQPRPGDTLMATCPLCGHGRARVLPFRYDFRGRFLQGVVCPACELARICPIPTDEEISSLYSEEYFTECSDRVGAHGRRAYMELAAGSARDRRRAAVRLDRLLREGRGHRGRFCEVGCGPGFFLAEMRSLGWEVQGLEISAFAAHQAREGLGLAVTVGALVVGALPRGAFQAVFLGDVLEHLPRPLEALAVVRESLVPGGVVAVAVPSTLNLVSARLGMAAYRVRGRNKTLRLPPYHLFEYTPRSLQRMLEASGFRVYRLRQSTVPLGKMGMRGSMVENTGKALGQVFSYATAALCNRGGDRLLILGSRPPQDHTGIPGHGSSRPEGTGNGEVSA